MMPLTNEKRLKYFCVFCVLVLILIYESECKGGRSGKGGSHGHSHGHSSGGHSSSHSTSHSSHGSSHSFSSGSGHSSSFGSGHSSSYGNGYSNSYGSGHSSTGAGSHTYGSSGSRYPYSYSGGIGAGSISHTGSSRPIGFEHVNQQAHNSLYGRPNGIADNSIHQTGGSKMIGFEHVNQQASSGKTNYGGSAGKAGIGFDHVNGQAGGRPYLPYKSQTVVHSGGYVHYQPPVQLQYSPVTTSHHSSTHYIPVYHPTIIQARSSVDSSHGNSFLDGYLVGRMSHSGHSNNYHTQQVTNTNNYYNNDNTESSNSNSYYTVHHYHHNRERVPSRFSVPGEDLAVCQSDTTDQLCVPNTSALCLKNGTIMCTTPTLLTTPCAKNSTEQCVYSRVPCSPNVVCNVTSNQSYIDFYLPCIANVRYISNRVLAGTYDNMQGSYELCVTAIAHPRKLESPFMALANFVTEFGKWHLEQLSEFHDSYF